jgi:hypothetical protein
MPLFTPPVGDGRLVGDPDDRSWAYFRHLGAWATGKTVWRDSLGVWHESIEPYEGGATSTHHDGATTITTGPDEGLATAQVVYAGGHVHTVTDAEAAALTAAGYGARINVEPVDIHWASQDPALFTRRLITQDGSAAFSLQSRDLLGQGVTTGAGASSSNQREWWTHNYTEGWADSEITTLWTPQTFGGAYTPQLGGVFRATNSGGLNHGIVYWSDVAFGSPTIINVGIWKTPDDGSGVNQFRSTFWTSPLGPVATNVFPYNIGARLTGTTLQLRVWRINQQPVPEFGDPVWSTSIDLNGFGDTVTYPTPTVGADGLWIAHSGTDPVSWSRFGNTFMERRD